MSVNLPNNDNDDSHDQYRLNLRATLWRLLAYYIFLAFVGGIIGFWLPDLTSFLPVGGLDQFNPAVDKHDSTLFTSPPMTGELGWFDSALRFTLALFCSVFLMLPVAWVYNATHEGDEFDHSIPETILVLPAVVAGVVMVVQHSLALAFSLAGIVAGVRFRRALQDTFDALFILTAISVGLATGVNAMEIAVVATVFFNFTAIITCYISPELESRFIYRKKQIAKDRKQTQEQIGNATCKEDSDITDSSQKDK